MIRRVLVSVTLCLSVAACGAFMSHPREPIPDGATVVRVTTVGEEVTLEPAVVPAGDVYLVLDEGSITFVQHMAAADATPGPLGDDDLARLARGDVMHTAISGVDAGGCNADQNREARGMMGPCGNVMQVSLVPGKYAVVAGSPEADPVTGATPPMAVLEVKG